MCHLKFYVLLRHLKSEGRSEVDKNLFIVTKKSVSKVSLPFVAHSVYKKCY